MLVVLILQDHNFVPLCLLLALLHVLVAEEGQSAADQDESVEADAHVGLAGSAGAGLRGSGGLLGFGGRVVGLVGNVSSRLLSAMGSKRCFEAGL